MFKKAERKRAKLRLALCGPSGSGKTYSALLIAQGLGGPIAMIDTENGSGELYSNITSYDVGTLQPPFTPDRYIAAIKEAEKNYNVLIIDSLSHAWAGVGGVLDMHDKVTQSSRAQNSYTAWRDVTPKHNALVDSIIGSSLHIIATMRTKTAYEMVDDNGKKKPVKIGLAPVQREGMDYEFTTVFDLSVTGHIATTSKDRTQLFDGKAFIPSIETGAFFLGWLNDVIENKPDIPTTITTDQAKELWKEIKESGLDLDRVTAWTSKAWNVHTLAELPSQHYETLRQNIKKWAAQYHPQQEATEAEEL